MPVGCGTFLVRKINDVITADDVSLQMPQTSLDGNPGLARKSSRTWVAVTMTLSKFLMIPWGTRAAESRHLDCDDEDGTEVMIFTIPKSKILRFSHQIPASRVTKEIQGVLKEIFEVDSRALPANVRRGEDH
ncbi:hypothetical protein Rs2_44936 [Raphanus sativus]|nr:hypothetical protein Rs2_44936 [Raphanus sativus]